MKPGEDPELLVYGEFGTDLKVEVFQGKEAPKADLSTSGSRRGRFETPKGVPVKLSRKSAGVYSAKLRFSAVRAGGGSSTGAGEYRVEAKNANGHISGSPAPFSFAQESDSNTQAESAQPKSLEEPSREANTAQQSSASKHIQESHTTIVQRVQRKRLTIRVELPEGLSEKDFTTEVRAPNGQVVDEATLEEDPQNKGHYKIQFYFDQEGEYTLTIRRNDTGEEVIQQTLNPVQMTSGQHTSTTVSSSYSSHSSFSGSSSSAVPVVPVVLVAPVLLQDQQVQEKEERCLRIFVVEYKCMEKMEKREAMEKWR